MKTKKSSRLIRLQGDCRCCLNPSNSFLELQSPTNVSDGLEKSYKDILFEITNLKIPPDQEQVMPQKICQKCTTQLRNSYKFIKQACEVSQQYLQTPIINNNDDDESDIKIFEDLQETLIEVPHPMIEESQDRIKTEPLSVVCIPNESINTDKLELEVIKEENEVHDSVNKNNDDSQEERDINPFCNTNVINANSSQTNDVLVTDIGDYVDNSNSDSSADDDDDDDVKSLAGDNIEGELSNEPIARCCDICHKVYRSEKFLRIHKRYTHMPENEKLPCPLCAYKASRSSALKVHMGLVHGHDKVNEYFKPVLDSGKKYPCTLCPRSYGRKDSLRKHIRRKHKNKSSPLEESKKKPKPAKQKLKERFLCTYCGQSYSSKCGLESHILTHTGERPFSCDICSKTFKRLKDLQLHRVIHSDEKPHQCSECGKAFKRVDKLKIHMRVHSELRPYKCTECEKTFKYPSVLRTHMHIHTGQTPFSCKTCGEAFSLRTSLNNHCLKNSHVK